MRARFLGAATLIAAVLACAPAFGQVAGYPSKPVRIVIPYPPGGAVDTLARAVGNELSKAWAQPVLIEGKPGAAGVTAATHVARSAGDGYTVYFTDLVPLAISPFLQRDLPYDPVKDFAAVIALVQSSSMFVVARNFPVNTIGELIAAAKAKPAAINFGTWGVASTAHLDTEEFSAAAGISMTHVPYKGAADMFRGLLGGEIQVAFISLGAATPQIKQGLLRAIAYGGPKRAPLMPNVPTMAESGLPGLGAFNVGSCLGIVVPAATPRAIINRIAADAARVSGDAAFADKFINGVGFEVFNLPPEPYEKLIAQSRVKYEALLKRLKLNVHG
jgi:tripartite-type tricarboxylate transporter receptor subunit TctC